MTDSVSAPWELFGSGRRGVLVTLKRDGRPQLSNVGYLYDAGSRSLLISVTDDRVKTRNIRRDAIAQIKELMKAKNITTDDERRGEESAQKVTDENIKKIDEIVAAKEQEMLAV